MWTLCASQVGKDGIKISVSISCVDDDESGDRPEVLIDDARISQVALVFLCRGHLDNPSVNMTTASVTMDT